MKSFDIDVRSDVALARQLAHDLLADELPRRWAHTQSVAARAEQLALALIPERVDDIVSAAWLHDVGYASALRHTGFHPVDGAAFLASGKWSFNDHVVGLVAYHTGASTEARERNLAGALAHFPRPDELDLAILSCADLHCGPDGAAVYPQSRLSEVLRRYPPADPVHRAITASGPLLAAQARVVQDAATAAAIRGPSAVAVPHRVGLNDDWPPRWEPVWENETYTATAVTVFEHPEYVVSVKLTRPGATLLPRQAAQLSMDLAAASAAASGEELRWTWYQAFVRRDCDLAVDDAHEKPVNPVLSDVMHTFDLADVLRLLSEVAGREGHLVIRQQTFWTLTDVTDWKIMSAVALQLT